MLGIVSPRRITWLDHRCNLKEAADDIIAIVVAEVNVSLFDEIVLQRGAEAEPKVQHAASTTSHALAFRLDHLTNSRRQLLEQGTDLWLALPSCDPSLFVMHVPLEPDISSPWHMQDCLVFTQKVGELGEASECVS